MFLPPHPPPPLPSILHIVAPIPYTLLVSLEENQVFVFKSRELFLNIHEATDLLEKQAAKSIMENFTLLLASAGENIVWVMNNSTNYIGEMTQ